MLREQVLAVVQQSHAGEPRDRHQSTCHRVVLDEDWEMGFRGLTGVRREVCQVVGQHAGPDDVDLEDIDIGRARRK